VSPTSQPGLNPPRLTTLIEIALACLVVALLLAGLAILLILRRQKRSRK
jgi:hypothetical protein